MIIYSTCCNKTNNLLKLFFFCCFFFPALSKAQQDTALGHKYYDKAYKATWKNGSYAKGIKLFIKASDAGYLPANVQLANIYTNGYYHATGGKPKALEYMTRSANAGDPAAMIYIGNVYFTGDRINQNFDSAIVWFSRAAALNDSKAMFLLGRLYDETKPPYHNSAKALYWFDEAAATGDNIAAKHKMLLYKKDGNGLYNMWLTFKDSSTSNMDVSDANIIVGLLMEASEMGCGRASNEEGIYYSHREHGGASAVSYFIKAREQGFNVSDYDMNYAIHSAEEDKNYISPLAARIGTTGNGTPGTNSSSTKTQHKCPYCKGTGTTETAGSKSLEQDKNGRWYNTYTPRSFSTCSYCKGTGYY